MPYMSVYHHFCQLRMESVTRVITHERVAVLDVAISKETFSFKTESLTSATAVSGPEAYILPLGVRLVEAIKCRILSDVIDDVVVGYANGLRRAVSSSRRRLGRACVYVPSDFQSCQRSSIGTQLRFCLLRAGGDTRCTARTSPALPQDLRWKEEERRGRGGLLAR